LVSFISTILLRESISRETLPKKANAQKSDENQTTFRIPVNIPVKNLSTDDTNNVDRLSDSEDEKENDQ